MSGMSDLISEISRRSEQRVRSIEQALESESAGLRQRLSEQLHSVERELRNDIDRLRRRLARTVAVLTAAILALLLVIVGGAAALTWWYVQPQRLAADLEARADLERSGMLVEQDGQKFVLLPPAAECYLNRGGSRRVCRLP